MSVLPFQAPLIWAARPDTRLWSSGHLGASALTFHRSLPGYARTPLIPAPNLARELDVGSVFVKDESDRMELSAFKVLGASWAVNCALTARLGNAPAESLSELKRLVDETPSARGATLVTATDGNHGRAVAWMARQLGLPARIYIAAGIDDAAVRAIAGEGAGVVTTGLVYDAAVAKAAASCAGRDGEVLVQDTAWAGYTEIPQRIVDGYATLFSEVDEQLGDADVDLVVVPTGVGSLLQAALEHYRFPGRTARPAVLSVEPVTAACVAASLEAHEPVSVDTSRPTTMTGLNCGTLSLTAWPAIAGGLTASIGVSDAAAFSAMASLAECGVSAGPCGAAALAGARAALSDSTKRDALEVPDRPVVVLVSTEGRDANPAAGFAGRPPAEAH